MSDYLDYTRSLREAGWHCVGNGYFSYVYAHDHDDHVLKVGIPDNVAKDGYPAYVGLCQKHRNNPHVPKIHNFEWRDRYYVAQIEKLRGTTEDLHAEDSGYRGLSKLAFHQKARIALFNGHSHHQFEQDHPELVELLIDIRESLGGVYRLDFHIGNGMWRNDGTFVVTDPVSYSERY